MVYRGYAAAGWNGMHKRKAVVSVNGVQTSETKLLTLVDATFKSCEQGWCSMVTLWKMQFDGLGWMDGLCTQNSTHHRD
jgi:hypothetical protein